MRMVLGLVGLLVVMGWVAYLNRSGVAGPAAPVTVTVTQPDGRQEALPPRAVEQQYRQALESAMDASRARMPEE